MLKEFKIKNFRSFKNEIYFTMEAESDQVSENKGHIFQNNYGENILKIASIYGPNAGGKSNLLKALMLLNDLFVYVTYSSLPQNGYFFRRKRVPEPFIFSKDLNKIIDATYFFVKDEYELGYNIAFQMNGQDNPITMFKEEVSYRRLDTNEYISLYTRENNTIISSILSNELNIANFQCADSMPFLLYLFTNFVNKDNKNNFGLRIINDLFIEITSIREIEPKNFTQRIISKDFYDTKKKLEVIKLINDCGIDINDIEIIKNNEGKITEVNCIHKIGNEDFKLSLDQESEGTQELIYLMPFLLSNLKDGGTIICDEIDAHLHPKLIEYIIKLFSSDYNTKAQIIFTSHDIVNMSIDNFRRDEIWFVCRDNDLVSDVYCLADFVNYKGEKVRKDAKISKQYLEGKFGADPFIKKGSSLYGD